MLEIVEGIGNKVVEGGFVSDETRLWKIPASNKGPFTKNVESKNDIQRKTSISSNWERTVRLDHWSRNCSCISDMHKIEGYHGIAKFII